MRLKQCLKEAMEALSDSEKKINDKREERGLFRASSFLNKEIKELIKNNESIRIDLIIRAHKILFTSMGGEDASIGGKFRKSNDQELKRIDGTPLKMTDYKNIANEVAVLDEELRTKTRNLKRPRRERQYKNVITLSARLSHRFASIHPFQNGNGRASRLLLNAILKRAELPWLESDVSIHFKKEEKEKYLSAMRQADDGDYSMLERMIKESLYQTNRKLYKQRQAANR